MKYQLKPIEEQVIVITGASSGIGLATARLAAKRGAKVVLAARSRSDLRRAARQIQREGGQAIYVVADVAEVKEVQSIAEHALNEYGRIDSWVNNAGTSVYGTLEETPLADARQIFETNYWGMVHGSLTAVGQLREQGGALINVGSIESERAAPLHGHYAASKHAVKGFTDALRMELEKEGAPISVTLVKPASVDTPFPRHARNLMEKEPKLPAPVYHPRVVARAILHCAEHPRRDVVVGGGGRVVTAMGKLTPRLTDRFMKGSLFEQQQRDEERPAKRRDTLYRSRKHGAEVQGDHPGHVMRMSAYTGAKLHPFRALLTIGALAAGAAMLLGNGGVMRDEPMK